MADIIYLARHGESKANLGPFFGMDTPLTQKGREDALKLRSFFSFNDVTAVITSDLLRAVQTAFIAFPRRFTFLIDRRFREIYFGDNECRTVTKELEEEIQHNISVNHLKYQGDDIIQRGDLALYAIQGYAKNVSGNIAIIGHDTLFECIIQRICPVDNFVLWKNRIPNGEVLQFNASDFIKYEVKP